MTLPRSRIITLSQFQPRQVLPFTVHRGDLVDVTVNWVRFMRNGETPTEVLSAASVAGRGVTITNVAFSGTYVSFTIGGVQATGMARISMAVSTNRGRTLSRSLTARTQWEDAVIDPVIPVPPVDPCTSIHVVTPGLDINGTYVSAGWDDNASVGNTGSIDNDVFDRPGVVEGEVVTIDGKILRLRALTSPDEDIHNLLHLSVRSTNVLAGFFLSSPPNIRVVEKDITFLGADAWFGSSSITGLCWNLPEGETPQSFFDQDLTFEITICEVEYLGFE